ncbi:MAG: phosphoribosylformylglycinamidine cyclo-ligase [Candidatus Omnitrophica bacterium]|nr:phosphoribosylformylglycinamidine cyclo-ligase [Candidatus Omnitrophota bacterium]MBD3269295.1 phosphoribosylformylglycinamidine cyclo-ligase [Candidatus Omnitrophota bacterium]
MRKTTYKKAGVDTRKADILIKNIKGMMMKPATAGISAFGSVFELRRFKRKYKEPVLVSSTDGVGTKLKIAQELNIHDTVGIDLVAMNVNDIVCLGGAPLFFLDYIACGKLDPQVLTRVVSGIKKGLDASGCLLLGGETAEMPGMYKRGEYDLAGFCVGITGKKKIINGKNIKRGDVLLGLESAGLHSNGFSLVRKALSPYQIKKNSSRILAPTRIYVKYLLSLLDYLSKKGMYNKVKGIAHVTGGSFYNKVTKILPPGYGISVNKDSWRVPDIFRFIQEKGKISEKEMYSVFNMGIGMVVVADKRYAEKIFNYLKRKMKVYFIGEVVKSDQQIKFV